MNLTKNFTLEELTDSATARRLGINNTPDAKVREQLKKLAVTILQPIRDKWRAPIVVSSGYRCARLNKAVGGSATSQHVYGQAADIHAVNRADNRKLWELIKLMVANKEIDTGQVIWEYGTKSNPQWIHVSLRGGHHNQFLYIGI